jgi:hypothetical protein
VACAFVYLGHAAVSQASNSPWPKNVLILYSFTACEALDEFRVVESTIRSRTSGPVDFAGRWNQNHVCVPLAGDSPIGAHLEQLDREAALTTKADDEVAP